MPFCRYFIPPQWLTYGDSGSHMRNIVCEPFLSASVIHLDGHPVGITSARKPRNLQVRSRGQAHRPPRSYQSSQIFLRRSNQRAPVTRHQTVRASKAKRRAWGSVATS